MRSRNPGIQNSDFTQTLVGIAHFLENVINFSNKFVKMELISQKSRDWKTAGIYTNKNAEYK